MFPVIHDAADFNHLQEDIDKLVAWAQKWQLRFNVSKCYLLHLGKPMINITFRETQYLPVIQLGTWVFLLMIN